MANLPNGENAVVDTENKLRRYCLNPNHRDRNGNLKGGHHAAPFLSVLGIDTEHAEMLTDELLKAASGGEAIHKGRRELIDDNGQAAYVDSYGIRFSMVGQNGRTAEIISGSQIGNNKPPQLWTCYVGREKAVDKIDLLDTVELIEDMLGTKFCRGMIGTVVDCLSADAFLVEFKDPDGDESLIDCFKRSQIKLDMSASEMEQTAGADIPKVTTGKMALSY